MQLLLGARGIRQLAEADLLGGALELGALAGDVADAVELAADGLNHPQAHDVLQETEALQIAALVREVLIPDGVRGDGALVLHAEQAPRSA